jgi:sulfite reductase subunit B
MTASEKLFEIQLDGNKPLGHKPGQFVEVSIYGVGEAPISVSSSPTRLNGAFELVVRKVGNVTGALHNMKAGDAVGIRGPFGTDFPANELKGRDLLFVAGGIGLVPARSFINYAIDHKKDYGRIIVLFGAKTPSDRLFAKEIEEWKNQVEFMETVDKGDANWKGNVGVITTLFPKINIDPRKTTAVIVGPPIMYKFVLIECKKKDISDNDIVMSLERRMKCGVGKCGHCQMNGIYVCQKGPVFRYSEIKDVKEAL